MTILIDIRPLMDERYSGVAEYTSRLLTALFSIDHENQYILLCNAFSGGRELNFDYQNVRIVTKHIPNRILNYPLLWLLHRPRFDKWVGRNLPAGRQEVDVFFMPHLNYFAVSKKVKTVIAVHDLSFLIHPEFFSAWKNLWHFFIDAKRLVRRFDRVVVFSEHSKRDVYDLCKIDEGKIKIIHSGIDESFKKLTTDSPDRERIKTKYNLQKPFILFLGTIEPRKNVEGLVDAFNFLKKEEKHKNLQLVLAGGRGWKSGPIFKHIKSSPYASDIIFLDYVDEQDRPALYNLAKVFAFPSFYEGFGFPPLEAMACGTPVIAAAASSLPEVVGQAGILVDPYNVTSIALGLDQVLANPELAKSLSQKGLEQAKKFNWLTTARDYLKLFHDLCQPHKNNLL